MNATTNELKLLAAKVTKVEEIIPPIESRVSAIEQINRNCDFPNSLTKLVQQNLLSKYEECTKRLTNIEKMEIEFN